MSIERPPAQDKSLVYASVAEASFDNILYVVWSRVANILSSSSSFASYFFKRFTEIYFIGHFFVQLSYLKQFGATFSEHFMGLKRRSIRNEGSDRLSKKEIILSLLFTSVASYIMQKLEQSNQNSRSRKSVKNLNLLIRVSTSLASTAQYIRYLSGMTDVVTLRHLAAGVKLEYSNEMPSQIGHIRELASQFMESSLILSAFFLQFFGQLQTENNRSVKRVNVPPPPVKHEYDVETKCVLCNLQLKNATILSLSGHIACHKCVSEFVEKFKRCPITNIPAEVSRLIQLQE